MSVWRVHTENTLSNVYTLYWCNCALCQLSCYLFASVMGSGRLPPTSCMCTSGNVVGLVVEFLLQNLWIFWAACLSSPTFLRQVRNTWIMKVEWITSPCCRKNPSSNNCALFLVLARISAECNQGINWHNWSHTEVRIVNECTCSSHFPSSESQWLKNAVPSSCHSKKMLWNPSIS